MNRDHKLEGTFERLLAAPAGGVLLQIALAEDGQAWLASPSGLFHCRVDASSEMVKGVPFAQIGAVGCFPGIESRPPLLLAAGLEQGVARSLDWGRTWHTAWIEQARSAVSCFAASPNFARDGLLLAGTQGDGILRSTDAGRYWSLVNFGLRNFSVFALLAVGGWDWQETVYAGTADGVYISPNGGRAWKFCGLEGKEVLSLAAGATSSGEPFLLAGTAEEGIWRSEDGGKTWHPAMESVGQVLQEGSGPYAVNAIWCEVGGAALAATSELGVLSSKDSGNTWQRTPGPEAALCLAGQGDAVFLGTGGEGLWRSHDRGKSWSPESGLAARRFQWLAQGSSWKGEASGGPVWLAGGVDVGLREGLGDRELEAGWQPVALWDGEAQMLCMACDGERIWAGAEGGVWMAAAGSQNWRKVLQGEEAILALALSRAPGTTGPHIWAGSAGGRLWVSPDGGASWKEMRTPFEGAPLSGLAARADGGELLAVTSQEARSEVQIWRCRMSEATPTTGPGALDWDLYYAEKTPWRAARLACGGASGEEWLIGLGNALIYRHAQTWRRSEIPASQGAIYALAWLPSAALWAAATAGGILVSDDLSEWRPVDGSPQGAVALLVSGQGAPWRGAPRQGAPRLGDAESLLALTLEGNLWKWSI